MDEYGFKEGMEIKKEFKISCCRSFLTPKGRCYTCPEEQFSEDDELKDPDEERW